MAFNRSRLYPAYTHLESFFLKMMMIFAAAGHQRLKVAADPWLFVEVCCGQILCPALGVHYKTTTVVKLGELV